jgi:hypothetical protein
MAQTYDLLAWLLLKDEEYHTQPFLKNCAGRCVPGFCR